MTRALTEAQRQAIADLDSVHQGKMAAARDTRTGDEKMREAAEKAARENNK